MNLENAIAAALADSDEDTDFAGIGNPHGTNDFGGIGALGNEEIIGALQEILVGADDPAEAALLEALAVSGDEGTAAGVLSNLTGDSAGQAKEALKMALARKIDPNAVTVRDRGYRDRRRFPLGFNSETVAAGDTETITASPQDLFRPERLIVPSDVAFDFNVVDVKVGTESQLVSQGEIPAAAFTEVSVDSYLHFRTAVVGNDISLSVRNKTVADEEISAALIGTAAR